MPRVQAMIGVKDECGKKFYNRTLQRGQTEKHDLSTVKEVWSLTLEEHRMLNIKLNGQVVTFLFNPAEEYHQNS